MSRAEFSPLQKQTVFELQEQIWKRERGAAHDAALVHSTGCEPLDALFPAQGVRGGTVVEWLGHGVASGAATLSLLAGRQVCPAGRAVVVIDTHHDLFPLGFEMLGFDLARLVLIRPASEREALWACEEALRCEGIGLVWARLEQLSSLGFRRLQLAAEGSRGVGFLLRSAKALRHPSWADARLLVQPCPSHQASPCYRVEVAYSHGRPRRSIVDIMLDSSRGAIHEVPSTIPTNSLPVVS